MKEVFYFFESRVVYRSFYEAEISMGNTSTGELEVDFLGKSERILRVLVNAGYKVYPVVILGSDLLGGIYKEYLKKIGCITDYICQVKENTDFVFVLEVEGKQQTVYRYVKKKSEAECRQYRRYCEELLAHRQYSAVLTGDMGQVLDAQGLAVRYPERVDRQVYTVPGTDGLTVVGSKEEIRGLAELLRKE